MYGLSLDGNEWLYMLVRSKKVKEDCELSTADSPDSPAVCESTTSTNQLLHPTVIESALI